MKRALAWIGGLAMVAAAAGVGELTLSDAEQQAPFPIDAVVGEPAVARTFAVTVREVRASEHVRDPRGWQAEGNWLVVDLDAEALGTEVSSILSIAELRVGDRLISASERPTSIESTPLDVGLPQSGSLAFELPAEATAGVVTLRLGRGLDERLDSIVELPIDLSTIERALEIELEANRWTT